MYQIAFSDEPSIRTLSKSLECKQFRLCLHCSPSDRHSYSLKYFKNPIR